MKVATLTDRKALQDNMEIEFIAPPNLDQALPTADASFPRRRPDPDMYEEVLGDILGKDKQRHLVDQDERKVGTMFKLIGDKPEAPLMNEDQNNLMLSQCSIAGCSRFAATVCVVCRVDGLCNKCYEANWLQSMKQYRTITASL